MQLLEFNYTVPNDDFTKAGAASSSTKNELKKLGFPPEVIRQVAIAMYEGEINMVIHAEGGTATVEIYEDRIVITLKDKGKGIPDIEKAMQAGFSTATEEVRTLGFGAGMGLPNIKKYTDNLEINSEIGVGTTLVMTVNL